MVKSFLKKHGFDLSSIDLEALLASFAAEMDAGLAGGKSSLAMIPSFLTTEGKIPVGRSVAVIDAGGTNLRVCTVSFDADGRPEISNFSKYAMPGVDKEVSADEFFSLLAEYAAPVLKYADDIGFCFSYACEITPDCDGKLLHWSKQIKAPEVVGRLVGSELRAKLEPMGFKGKITVLNDTVATLLAGVSAGIARPYSAYVGVILGTGTNTATVVSNDSITKCPDLPQGSMIINMETGDFDPVPMTEFDERLHSRTLDPGKFRFEKQISGGYLGDLGLAFLQMAAEDGLFSEGAAKGILALEALENKDLDNFCDDPSVTGNALSELDLTDDDRRTIQEIGEAVYTRAAILSAVNVAAGVIRSGGGKDSLAPVCVNIDGSTYYRTRTAEFKSRTEEVVRSLLEPRGITYRAVNIPDSPVIGAAVAGLTR